MSATPPRASRQVAAFVVVFFSGMVLGWALTLASLPARPESPNELTKQVLATLQAELLLDTQQSEEIQLILQKHHESLQEIRSSTRTKVFAEFNLLEQQVASVLMEHQQARWKAILKQMRHRWLPDSESSGSHSE